MNLSSKDYTFTLQTGIPWAYYHWNWQSQPGFPGVYYVIKPRNRTNVLGLTYQDSRYKDWTAVSTNNTTHSIIFKRHFKTNVEAADHLFGQLFLKSL
jgi:hypothetical protein